jgi:hypothetical protein
VDVPAPAPDFLDAAFRAIADAPGRRDHPARVLRLVDAWGWLGWLADDLTTLGVLVAPARTGERVPSR